MFSLIPQHVVDAWEADAVAYLERQLTHHRRHDHEHPFESCWFCTRQKAICKSKRRYDDMDEATGACDELNTPTSPTLMVQYRCFWSPGLHWHLTTAKATRRKSTARKRMARRLSQI